MKLPPMARTFNSFVGVMNSIVRYIFSGTANFYIRQFPPRDWQYVGPSKIWLGNVDNGYRWVYWVHIFFSCCQNIYILVVLFAWQLAKLEGRLRSIENIFGPNQLYLHNKTENEGFVGVTVHFMKQLQRDWNWHMEAATKCTTFRNAFPWIKVF